MGTLSSALPSVSIVGLGLMGRPMARTLLAAGFDVRGWNRSELDLALVEGIPRSALAEAAAADVVLLVLADTVATGKVLEQLESHLRAGSVVLDLGSSDPADSRVRAARLAERGIGWVDAPVSGGPEGAASGTLAIMAGGEAADFGRVRPVLDALGGTVTLVGVAGAGHLMKIVNQVIVALSIDVTAEALALAEAAGFSIPEVQAAVRGGSADTPQLRAQGTRMARRDWEPCGRVRTMLKDLRMARGVAEAVGLPIPLIDAAIDRYAALADRGDDGQDVSVMFDLARDERAGDSYQAITDELLVTTRGSRTTIRLDRPGGVYPAVAESLAPGVKSIAGVEVPGLREAATMRRLVETLEPYVQDDLLDTDVPPPPALIEVYGARAQMLAPIVRRGDLAGLVSVHVGPDPRRWTDDDLAAIKGAANRATALLLAEERT